jgi:glutathione S-transferase
MVWVQLITALALLQYFLFGILAGKARGQYGVKAPAMTGHEVFERYNRVHVNTLETLVVFVPSLWLAASFFPPHWVAAIGAVYLIGRVIYLRAYVSNPSTRTLGYTLSALPVLVLIIMALFGICRVLFTT